MGIDVVTVWDALHSWLVGGTRHTTPGVNIIDPGVVYTLPGGGVLSGLSGLGGLSGLCG